MNSTALPTHDSELALPEPRARLRLPLGLPFRRPMRWPSWSKEPLLHFLLLGALVFAVDHVLVTRADSPRTIVVSEEVDREAVATFEAKRGHAPSDQELRALHRVWLDNEVLYREGLALELDRGDPAIRERVIFKMLSLIDSQVRVQPPSDAELSAWFEAHRDKYDEPARLSFDEAVLSGENTEQRVRDFVAELNTGTPFDTQAALRVFKDRPRSNLVQSYGADVAGALLDAPVGRWQAYATRDGFRAMRLNRKSAARPASFETIRNMVLQDYRDQKAAEQRTAEVRARQEKYEIVYDPATWEDDE